MTSIQLPLGFNKYMHVDYMPEQSQLLQVFRQSSKTSLQCIIWKENGGAHVNNAYESHKLT